MEHRIRVARWLQFSEFKFCGVGRHHHTEVGGADDLNALGEHVEDLSGEEEVCVVSYALVAAFQGCHMTQYHIRVATYIVPARRRRCSW